MSGMSEAFLSHIRTGNTTLCRCWAIRRNDGVIHGFTDHDQDLIFEGIEFRANTGLDAVALQQGTGLSVDNSEAMGALTDAAVREEDIDAGIYDSAELRAWRVNWADVNIRWLQFRGSIGEIRRGDGVFHAELRGLTDVLNRPIGRVYQKPCTAVLGDRYCAFDLSTAGYSVELDLDVVVEGRRFEWPNLNGFEAGWFRYGRLTVLSGDAAGLWGAIKSDTAGDRVRSITLWEAIRKQVQRGDRVRLDAGCDKRFGTCKSKFNNLLNFQGFPDIPNEDWMLTVPKKTGRNTGGSLR